MADTRSPHIDGAGNRIGSRSVKAQGSGGGTGGGGRKKLALLPLAALLLLLLVALAVALIVFNPADDGDRSGLDFRNDKKVSAQSDTSQPSGGQGATPNSQGSQTPAASPATGTGTLVAGGRNVIDEAVAGRYAQLNGQAAEGRGVTVQSVVSDEGFWVGSSEANRAFVFLSPQARTKAGESPFQVRAGQVVDLSGVVKPVPVDLTPFGVDQAEGAPQLRSQGGYVEATTFRIA